MNGEKSSMLALLLFVTRLPLLHPAKDEHDPARGCTKSLDPGVYHQPSNKMGATLLYLGATAVSGPSGTIINRTLSRTWYHAKKEYQVNNL